jgi:NADPH-dependent 2,4-dienoyl-CoA reductase/sulfur reductase-like enzyme
MKRRQFIRTATGTSIALSASLLPFAARAAASYNVIVVGGGMAGATVAKYLRLWSRNELSVALIEKDASYVSNIMSNEVLTGKRASVGTLAYSYSTLTSKYGVNRLQGTVTGIDAINKTVTYSTPSGNVVLTYDRLVLAPGLEFDLMPGMSSASQYDTLVPHAWKAGPQTTLLRQQLLAMPDYQNVVITIPPAPYRCPPGPYERACVIADWLKTNRPNSKLIVLDANNTIQAQATNFQNAFNGAYGYRVDYRPGCAVTNLQLVAGANTVTFTQNSSTQAVTAAVLNPIPPQRAPALLVDSGLVSGKFAPVNLLSYESTLKPGIHVIGDACNSGMPKAGHIGNQEAKTCANAIVNALKGSQYALAEASPVLNSACFTPVTSTQATWLSAVYQYSSGVMVPSTQNGATQPRSATAASTGNYSDMEKWFKTLMSDTFA